MTLPTLPDDVIRRIMEFLDMESLSRFMCCSRRFSEYGASLRHLIVDFSKLKLEENPVRRRHFFEFLDWYMTYRNGNFLEMLTFVWGEILDDEHTSIVRLLDQAVECNVHHLGLHFYLAGDNGSDFVLPFFVFHHQSLTSLLLRDGILGNLPAVDCSGLEGLVLANVEVQNETFGEWISFSCSRLEELDLLQVKGLSNFVIQSSSLQRLLISTYPVQQHVNISAPNLENLTVALSYCSQDCSLTVDAPKLKWFTLDGYLYQNIILSNFNQLVAAQICVEIDSYIPNVHEASIDPFLQTVQKYTHLCLSGRFLESLLLRNGQTTILRNVEYLILHLHRKRDRQIPKIAFFLQGLPRLKHLYVIYCLDYVEGLKKRSLDLWQSTQDDDELWGPQNLGVIHKLEIVDMEIRTGFVDMELVKYFFEHAISLQGIYIRYSPKEFQAADIEAQTEVLNRTRPAAVNIFFTPRLFQPQNMIHAVPFYARRFFRL